MIKEEALILIVDDNLRNLNMLSNMLADNNYNVATVSEGEVALEFVKKRLPDLIILDIIMPGFDGFEICKRLKANPATEEIPIIFLSALDSINDKLKGFELGAIDFITKPFQNQEVIARVRNQLELKEARQKVEKKAAEQELLLENIDIQIWYLKDQHTYGKVNSAFAEFLGLKKEEVEGKNICHFLDGEKCSIYANGTQEIFEEKLSISEEKWVENYKGELRLLSINKIPKLNNEEEVEYAICWARDITEERERQKQINYLTFYDQLTDLYNKTYFEEELSRYDTKRQLPITIIFIDVNGLKLINDVFGHQVGDELLSIAGEIIQDCCRQEDLAARWGGDEFIILLSRLDEAAAQSICQRINEECQKRKLKSINPSLSLGYAVKRKVREDIEQTFREAEEQMYSQKIDQGKQFRKKVLAILKTKLAEKAYETSTHLENLRKFSLKLGVICELSTKNLNKLELLAEYHDIGKVIIPTEILKKTEKLKKEDWQEIKKHSKAGYQIVRSTYLGNISEEILAHHEWWNGEGYPRGLAGTEIPLLVRIFAIVEAYQVMREGRPYQKALSKQTVIEKLKSMAGIQFDPELVKLFIEGVVNC